MAYFQALDALDYGQGKSADETSCRLLARRFGTERVRLVLATGIEAWTQDDHKYTWDQLSSMKGIGPVFKQILDACVNVPIGGRETYNGELLRETPDARKAGFMGSMAEAGSGEPVNDPELVNDVARQVPPNPEHYERLSMPEEVEAAESIANAMGVALKRAPEIVASESLATLATWAVIVKAIISLFSVPNFDAREHEVLAAQLTPFFLAFFQVMIQEGWGIDQSKLQALHAQSEGTLPAY
ncbi:MAG TPA: hypothetical protein VNV87_01775 [Acidimicrobiales bacterium]|nr:hypothetical protein [Acidimicrobiales bacterium]